MIKPVNYNIIIEPLKYDSFIPLDKGNYEEVGIVIDFESNVKCPALQKGVKVYFDSWLASKYPKNEKEFFWIVNFNDIKAIDNGKN